MINGNGSTNGKEDEDRLNKLFEALNEKAKELVDDDSLFGDAHGLTRTAEISRVLIYLAVTMILAAASSFPETKEMTPASVCDAVKDVSKKALATIKYGAHFHMLED